MRRFRVRGLLQSFTGIVAELVNKGIVEAKGVDGKIKRQGQVDSLDALSKSIIRVAGFDDAICLANSILCKAPSPSVDVSQVGQSCYTQTGSPNSVFFSMLTCSVFMSPFLRWEHVMPLQ